jgi:hypothetical protein
MVIWSPDGKRIAIAPINVCVFDANTAVRNDASAPRSRVWSPGRRGPAELCSSVPTEGFLAIGLHAYSLFDVDSGQFELAPFVKNA